MLLGLSKPALAAAWADQWDCLNDWTLLPASNGASATGLSGLASVIDHDSDGPTRQHLATLPAGGIQPQDANTNPQVCASAPCCGTLYMVSVRC